MPENQSFETKVVAKLTHIEDTLERNTDSLVEHIKRTNLLEEDMQNRISPIENHIKEVSGVLKFLKGVVILLGAVATLIAIMKGLGAI